MQSDTSVEPDSPESSVQVPTVEVTAAAGSAVEETTDDTAENPNTSDDSQSVSASENNYHPMETFLKSQAQADVATRALPSADMTKKVEGINHGVAKVCSVSVKGWRSATEQVTCIKSCDDGKVCVALLDGYGTKKCAEYIANELGYCITSAVADNLEYIRENPHGLSESICDMHTILDQDFLLGELEESTAGCTSAMAVLSEGHCLIAHVGDTMAFACRNEKAVPLTCAHEVIADATLDAALEIVTPYKAQGSEKPYIKKRKGSDVMIGVTRTFGLMALKETDHEALSAVPDVSLMELCDDDTFIVLTTRALLQVRTQQEIVDAILSGLQARKELHTLIGELLDDVVSTNKGVGNLSLIVILPRLRVEPPNPLLRSTDGRLLDDWRNAGCEESRFCALIREQMPVLSEPDEMCTNSMLEEKEGGTGSGSGLHREDSALPLTMKREGGRGRERVPCESTAVANFARLHNTAELVWLRWGGIVLGGIAAAWAVLCYGHGEFVAAVPPTVATALMAAAVVFMSVKEPDEVTLVPWSRDVLKGAFGITTGLVVSLGFDLLSGCSYSGYDTAFAVMVVMSCYCLQAPFILLYGLIAVVWVFLRTLDEGEDYGLIRGLPEPLQMAAASAGAGRVGRDQGWTAVDTFLRVTCMCVAGTGAAYKSWWELRNKKRLETALRCVCLALEQTRDRSNSARDALVSLATTIDSEGILALQLIELARLGKKRPSRVDSTPKIENVESTEVISIGKSIGSSTDSAMSLYSDTHSRSASPKRAAASDDRGIAQIQKTKNVTVLSVLLSSDKDAGQEVPLLAKAIAFALDASEGRLARFEGNTALLAWNDVDPCVTHQQAAVNCALSLLGQCGGQCAVHVALSTGMVSVGTDTFGKAKQFVLGRCINQAQLLAHLCRAIKVKMAMTDRVYEGVRQLIYGRPIDAVVMSDKNRPEVIYEYVGSRTDPMPRTCSPLFTEAFSLLQQLKLKEAKESFRRYLDLNDGDKQAKRLMIIAEWLIETNMFYIDGASSYSRQLLSEVEHLSRCNTETNANDADSQASCRSPKSRSLAEPQGFNPLIKRESLNHDKILRRQIRDAEAEANAHELEAWGLTTGGVSQKKKKDAGAGGGEAGGSGKELPKRFTDHKNRLWCRASRQLGKGAFGEVWLGMSSDGSLVAMKSMRLPTLSAVAKKDEPAKGAGGEQMSAAAKRRLARKMGAQNNASVNKQENQGIQQIEDLLSEVALMHKLRHENIVCQPLRVSPCANKTPTYPPPPHAQVSYMASAVVDGYIMIVMEYLSGGSLQDMLTNFTIGTIPHSSIQRYMRDIAKGLEFLYGA